ncbi:hypothetical protein GH714_017467 [Hevea brasiliensis]|uniref:Rx N-terminal domain-containing protein n=1 Tax=Hevea brasiliensis TaxID=3981 RepID=A0A6A6N2U1_HEVBR|nr:hypothetical protein GH714_017467 [Hevea brasiliensis]
MAEGVLFDIAGEIIMKVGPQALQEIEVWWGVKDELQKLKGTVSRIRAVLLDAEKKSALNEQVKVWLGKLQEIVYDADDLIDDFATEALQRRVMTGNRMTKEHSGTLRLKGLSPTESWSLFLRVALKGQEPKDSSVKKTGEEIVSKCVGVPLAIKTIASILCFKNPETEWPVFLQEELSKIAQNENDILPTLQLSYDHLPSHLKHCFAFCALFPKDYVIRVKKLIHLWAVQGFIESSSSSLCDEDIELQYFTELWWRSFFQEVERDELGNVESCKMHDLMHDLATSVAAGKGICRINSEEKSVDESVRHVSFDFPLYSSQQITAGLSNPLKLRTFFFAMRND